MAKDTIDTVLLPLMDLQLCNLLDFDVFDVSVVFLRRTDDGWTV